MSPAPTPPPPPPPLRYRIRHLTRYAYGGEVVHSHQMLRLTPRPMPHQRTVSHSIVVIPKPAVRVDSIDAFGNPVVRMQLDRPHDYLAVDAQMVVEVHERPARAACDSEAWDTLARSLCYAAQALTPEDLEVRRYRSESAFVRIKHDFSDYSRDCFPAGQPVLECAEDLMEKIHEEFTYAPGETQISTPLLEVLEQRRGVCQDFAHFMIACLRSQGLAARYVSGYLRTQSRSEAAREELVGADASHAWIAVYAPPFGWVALDPTNNRRVDRDHITLAWGRDFGDVSPLRGVILGGGSHDLTVNVAVKPIPLAS